MHMLWLEGMPYVSHSLNICTHGTVITIVSDGIEAQDMQRPSLDDDSETRCSGVIGRLGRESFDGSLFFP